MLKDGKKPIMEIIEEIECERDSDWHEAERFWISYFRFLGFPLTNLESGGQGPGRIAKETRTKMSEVRKGKPGRPMTPEVKEKLIASHIGVPWTEKSKEKLRKTMRETNAVQRVRDAPRPEHPWNKGIPSSEETKAKQSASHKARGTGKGEKSPEHREKLRQANLGKKLSEEHRAALRGPRGPNIRTLRKLGLTSVH